MGRRFDTKWRYSLLVGWRYFLRFFLFEFAGVCCEIYCVFAIVEFVLMSILFGQWFDGVKLLCFCNCSSLLCFCDFSSDFSCSEFAVKYIVILLLTNSCWCLLLFEMATVIFLQRSDFSDFASTWENCGNDSRKRKSHFGSSVSSPRWRDKFNKKSQIF